MKRLVLPFITALVTFFGSVTFMQIWERSYTKTTQSATSILKNRTETEDDIKARLLVAEDEFIRCVSPRMLVTATEAEKQRRECSAQWGRTRRNILQGGK